MTRLIGFGLCLLGAFFIGYGQGVQTAVGNVAGFVAEASGSIPGLSGNMTAQISSYVQQTTPSLGTYWEAGVPLVAAGVLLVIRGDGKPKKVQEGKQTEAAVAN